jgi:carbonic anhydrase
MRWLDSILEENRRFREQVRAERLPAEREPCPYAVVTCMDPRVNLAAVGILPFAPDGGIQSQARVIRTLGAIAEDRSLVVGIHLAGFKEVAVVMHTDCGCSLAYSKVDTLIENMQSNLSPERWNRFKELIGEPLRDMLREWLHAFQDPREAVRTEVDAVKNHPFAPESLVVHGLVYDLSSGAIEVVVNGYES